LIAIGNARAGDPQLVATARNRLGDRAPLVRATAVWAFARLVPVAEVDAERARRLPGEGDPLVREEWQRCGESTAALKLGQRHA